MSLILSDSHAIAVRDGNRDGSLLAGNISEDERDCNNDTEFRKNLKENK